MHSLITLHHLRIFSALGEYQNVRKAAEKVSITQSAVSHQLRILSEQCRDKLYKKASRGVTLTLKGQEFLQEAIDILSRLDKLEHRFGVATKTADTQTLTIGASYDLADYHLPRLIGLLKLRYPALKVSYTISNSKQITAFIESGTVDVGLVSTVQSPVGYVALPYVTNTYVAFVSPRHPLVKRACITLEALASVPLIIQSREDNDHPESVARLARTLGVRLTNLMQFETAAAVKAAVSTGVGVGILDNNLVRSDLKAGTVQLLKIPKLHFERQTYVLYRTDNLSRAVSQALLSSLRRVAHNPRLFIEREL